MENSKAKHALLNSESKEMVYYNFRTCPNLQSKDYATMLCSSHRQVLFFEC